MRKYSGKNLKVDANKRNLANFSERLPVCVENLTSDYRARVAIYDNLLSTPRIKEIIGANVSDFIEKLSTETYHLAHQQGGKIPYTLIREVVENLIHAYFKDAVITILQNGNILRISDRGGGIKDKQKALLPGFTTATEEVKRYIRGVGSGLPIVLETVKFLGGALTIEDNIEEGTVVTISLIPENAPPPEEGKDSLEVSDIAPKDVTNLNKLNAPDLISALNMRQKKILLLIGELEEAGPSDISREMKMGVSTSFKELNYLEKKGFLKRLNNGKRHLTDKGMKVLELIFKE